MHHPCRQNVMNPKVEQKMVAVSENITHTMKPMSSTSGACRRWWMWRIGMLNLKVSQSSCGDKDGKPVCLGHEDDCRQTYLCPLLLVEYRPSMTPRHRPLFWAALVIPDHLGPRCFSSASVSRLQLLRGRPLFLFPCGFQVKAWCVVLNAGSWGCVQSSPIQAD